MNVTFIINMISFETKISPSNIHYNIQRFGYFNIK